MQTFDTLSSPLSIFPPVSFLYSHNEASVQHLPLKNSILVTAFSPPPLAHLSRALKLLLRFLIPPFCYHKSQLLFSYSLLILVRQSARIRFIIRPCDRRLLPLDFYPWQDSCSSLTLSISSPLCFTSWLLSERRKLARGLPTSAQNNTQSKVFLRLNRPI